MDIRRQVPFLFLLTDHAPRSDFRCRFSWSDFSQNRSSRINQSSENERRACRQSCRGPDTQAWHISRRSQVLVTLSLGWVKIWDWPRNVQGKILWRYLAGIANKSTGKFGGNTVIQRNLNQKKINNFNIEDPFVKEIIEISVWNVLLERNSV